MEVLPKRCRWRPFTQNLSGNAMTAQQRDTMFFRDRQYLLESHPLDWYWARTGSRPKMAIQGTDNYRGYTASWRVEDRIVYLTKIDGLAFADRLGRIVRTKTEPLEQRLSDRPRRTRRVSVKSLFPLEALRSLFSGARGVPATWITGDLRLSAGEIVHNTMWDCVHEDELLLIVDNGRVVDTYRKKSVDVLASQVYDLIADGFESLLSAKMFRKHWTGLLGFLYEVPEESVVSEMEPVDQHQMQRLFALRDLLESMGDRVLSEDEVNEVAYATRTELALIRDRLVALRTRSSS